MDIDDISKAAQQLNDHFRHLYLQPQFIGIRISADGKQAQFVVEKTSQIIGALQTELNAQVASGIFSRLGISQFLVVEEDLPKAQAYLLAGTAGYGSGLPGFGTIGWSFVLDKEVLAVSNWHVLCPMGNDTPRKHPVFGTTTSGTQKIGELYDFNPVYLNTANLWDFALLRYDDPLMPAEEFVGCASGQSYPYPRHLGFTQDVNQNDLYYTVGASPSDPVCSEGKFLYYGSSKVNYGSFIALFFEQLFFSPITAPGDSGSIVVNKVSNKVVGLIFAGTVGQVSLANPLYRKGWSFKGSLVLRDNVEIPVFESKESGKQELFKLPEGTTSDLPPIFQPPQIITHIVPADSITDFYLNRGGKVEKIEVEEPLGNSWVQLRIHVVLSGAGVSRLWWLNTNGGVLYTTEGP